MSTQDAAAHKTGKIFYDCLGNLSAAENGASCVALGLLLGVVAAQVFSVWS